ncbi:magnesium-translocating P-type ATPase [Ruicaihuangia caeni]|uniref:magnesium-translocating P-type ATPase n=1 Tax=Ruicaihuangia caeni TaxID=3042517 RepID=UPI003390313D
MPRRSPIDTTQQVAYWARPVDEVLGSVRSTSEGLSQAEATERRATEADPLGEHRRRPALRILIGQYTNPISIVLIGATIVSMALGDVLDGSIIIAIIAASGLLGFWQESRADNAVAELLASVQVKARVLRDGRVAEVRLGDVVVGDVVELSAGDLVPADARLLQSRELQVDASALTGESFPLEKDAAAIVEADATVAARSNVVQLGSHVVSGTARAVVVATGRDTEFGGVAHAVAAADVRTAFEFGIARFGWLLARLVAVLTVLIFIVNWIYGRPVLDSLLFALSLAVGITPQMLPAIVSLSLSVGARHLAQRRVVVKRLDAIEDLGAITVLCTDKTGTLTTGAVELSRAVTADGVRSDRVMQLAAINASAQRGFRNPLDAIILAAHAVDATALAELPYDFQRKRLSVLVPRGMVDTPDNELLDETPNHSSAGSSALLVTKGSVGTVLPLCVTVRAADGGESPLTTSEVQAFADQLAAEGNRVLAVASRAMPALHALSVDDETDLTFEGLLVFRDPAKAGAAEAVASLQDAGVRVVLITGDSAATARATAEAVGIPADTVVTGQELGALDTARLAVAFRDVRVFAEVEPMHKARIVSALRASREVVGFLGDGINDAVALHAADVGISVDTAVDVAKQAASVVLLEKGLDVVADGVRLGRRTFANTLKYIRLTTSANFGNMASLAVASLVLPFLPLLPRQILLLNFLSDIPAMTIAADEVDREQLKKPIHWNLRRLQVFMLVFGLLSTVFDLITFAVLVWGFGAGSVEFQSAWFVMSTLTELAVLFSLRTARPIWKSRPAVALVLSSVAVAVVTLALPYIGPAATVMGLEPPPALLLAALGAVLVLYIAANEVLKRRMPGLLH